MTRILRAIARAMVSFTEAGQPEPSRAERRRDFFEQHRPGRTP
jgi:hypothetical protein